MKVLNPKNNIRLGALESEAAIEATDLALFDDVSVPSGQKARTTTWANIFARLFNLDQYTTETTILDADKIVFRDSAVVSGQSTKLITVANLTTKILAPVLNSFIPTGVGAPWFGGNAPSGWVWLAGRTIGNASSGATERANADTAALFTLLWNNFSNTALPIQTSGGLATTRDATAALDYAANKRLPLPDLRGRTLFGLDDMGGSAANRLTSAAGNLDGVTPGAGGGVQSSGLAIQNIPSHTHSVTYRRAIEGPLEVDVTLGGASTRRFMSPSSPPDADATVVSTTAGQVSPDSFSNVPPGLVAWWIAKL